MARQRFALVAALAFIAAATLLPAPDETWQREFWCIRCDGSFDPVELVLNVLLFVPLGLALRAAGVRTAFAIATIVGTTVSIELLQYTVIVGRDGTIRDCLTNTIGGLAGFVVQPHAAVSWRAGQRRSGRLAWTGALFWIAHAVMASFLFRPAPHRRPVPDVGSRGAFFAQIAPRLGQFDDFEGTVLSPRIDSVLVRDGPFPAELQSIVPGARSIAMAAVVAGGSPTRHVAPILNVADGETHEIAILGQQQTSLVFQARVRAQDVGFNAPAVVLDDVFPIGEGTSAEVVGTRRGFVLRARTTEASGRTRYATLALSPSLGWALWWPGDFPSSLALGWLTALWLFVPVGLIGFWSAERGRLNARWIAPPFVAAIAAHAVVPLIVGPNVLVWLHLGIALAGGVVGLTLGRLRSARQRESLGP